MEAHFRAPQIEEVAAPVGRFPRGGMRPASDLEESVVPARSLLGVSAFASECRFETAARDAVRFAGEILKTEMAGYFNSRNRLARSCVCWRKILPAKMTGGFNREGDGDLTAPRSSIS